MKKNTINETKLRLLTDHIVKNATYLGLSESTIQNMLRTAFESDPNLKIVVKQTDSRGVGKHCKHYSRMPHHALPNCTRYENKTSKYDMIGAIFGLMKRLDKGQRIVWNGKNIRANRYVEYVMNQLGHYRDRGQNKYYWRHALRLLESPAFQMMAFNYVCHNWHRELSLTEVNQILKKVDELVQSLGTEINMRRVYIEKANGKWRPLGVPTKAWRVYLHMLNVLVVWFRTGTDTNQHAYKPKSGVHTAWQSLLEKVDNPNIYEFDLESFFPSVSLTGMQEILVQELGMPEIIAGLLIDINRSLTKLNKEDKLPETRDRQVLLNTTGGPNPNLPADIRKLIKDLQNSCSNEVESRNMQEALKGILPPHWTLYKEIGVPQGSAISCGISTVSLHYIWKALGDQLLMYADDGLVFPRDSIDLKVEDLDRGIRQNMSKSGWIKRDGKWLKPLKFLGLELIPGTEADPARIRAKTRNGSTKEYTIDRMFLVYLLNERDLLMWASENPDWTESDSSTENVILIRDQRGQTLLKELTYDGLRNKITNRVITKCETSRKLLASIIGDLKKNVSFSEWIRNASQRFQSLKNPLSQLFESHGLSELSKLYEGKKEGTIRAVRPTLTCSRKSWAYQKLGGALYRKIREYRPSDSMISQLENVRFKGKSAELKYAQGLSGWDIIENSKTLLTLWRNNFKIIGHTPQRMDGIWKVLEADIREWLQSLTIDVHNASTYAVEYLLESKLRISEKSRICHSKANRVHTITPSDTELENQGVRMIKRQEREFKRQYGLWPSRLRISKDALT